MLAMLLPSVALGVTWEYADALGRVVVVEKDTAMPTAESLPTVGPTTSSTRPGCRPYPVGPNSPTGIVGCQLAGLTTGIASWYSGSAVAANWCEWPWTTCGSVTITALDTGISLTATVAMYCDCYTGTADERLLDLPRDLVVALGLDLSRGLYAVTVTPN
jgi:hypothetical protein